MIRGEVRRAYSDNAVANKNTNTNTNTNKKDVVSARLASPASSSSSSPDFPVSFEANQEWQKAIKPDKPYRFLLFQFKGETLHFVNKVLTSPSPVRDFDKMKDLVVENEAYYIVFRIEDSNSWSLISYVPEDAAIKTQEKMMYAVSKNSLKTRLGAGYFAQDWHVTSKRSLTYINFKNEMSQQSEAALSEKERVAKSVIKEEEEERKRLMSLMATPNVFGKTAINQVDVTFGADLQRDIQRYNDGQINFLQISLKNETAIIERASNLSTLDEVRNAISPISPAYYVFSHRNGAVLSNIFLYCCPEKSPHGNRLIFATRMKTVREKLNAANLKIAKTVEIQDTKDFDSQISGRPTYEGPGVVADRREVLKHTVAASPKVDKPHPLFGVQGGGLGPKKKIVMPPAAAYQ